MYNYQAEFLCYLDEVKGMNMEEMSNGMVSDSARCLPIVWPWSDRDRDRDRDHDRDRDRVTVSAPPRGPCSADMCSLCGADEVRVPRLHGGLQHSDDAAREVLRNGKGAIPGHFCFVWLSFGVHLSSIFALKSHSFCLQFEAQQSALKKGKAEKLLRKQMKTAAREGNTQMDETLLHEQRKARFEQERLNADQAELGEMAVAAREREASSMARILGLVNKSMNADAG